MKNPVEQFRMGVSEGEDEEVLWTNCQGQQESCTLIRYVSPIKMRRTCINKVSLMAVCGMQMTTKILVLICDIDTSTSCKDIDFCSKFYFSYPTNV